MVIELLLIKYLSELYPTYAEIPDKKPKIYCVIEKTSSSESDLIAEATVAIQTYTPSMQEAMEANEAVKAHMDFLPTLPEICNCRLNSDYNYTDTSTKKYRYQAVYDIKYYRRTTDVN